MSSRERLEAFLKERGAAGEIISFSGSVHTVAEAAKEAGVGEGDLIKTVVVLAENVPIIAIIPGDKRLDLGKFRLLCGTGKVRIASPEEVLETTGYPAGGVPPVFEGFKGLKILIDPLVLGRELVLGGGGDSQSLLRISPREIVRISGAVEADISA
ncbi:MAG: YbaK/EbsC family protein [archaeon]